MTRLDAVVRNSAAAVLAAALLCMQTAPPAAAQQTALPAAIAQLDERLARDVAADDVGSIAAAVVVDGRVVWAAAYGWADRDRRIPADTSHLYRTGSITKSFTAVAAAALAERGALSWDDPVHRWVPEIERLADGDVHARTITLRQLASHTAGLIREPRLQGAAAGPIATWESKILESIPATAFEHAPGERYLYSNIAFGILGFAAGRAAGEDFMALSQRVILEPLGMASSTFIVGDDLAPRLAAGYSNSARGIDAAGPAREHAGRGYKVPNGGLYSTVGDLARFIAGMSGRYGDGFLSDATLAEIFRVQTPDGGARYGLGFSLSGGPDGTTLVGHGGSVAGYTAHLIFEPVSATGVILLRNYNSGATNLSGVAAQTLRSLLEVR